MRYQEYMDIIRTVNDRFRYYKSIESLFELDQWSGLPELGGAYRQQMSAFVGTQKAAPNYKCPTKSQNVGTINNNQEGDNRSCRPLDYYL